MTVDLSGKRAIVTGSTSGIGGAIALALAEARADVVVNGRDPERVKAMAEHISSTTGAACFPVAADLATSQGVGGLFAGALEHLGGLDIFVNNAGQTHIAPSEQVSEEVWRHLIDLNLTGPFLCAQRAGSIMLEQGSGVIVNIASIAGEVALPGRAAYCASKHGLVGLTKVLGTEWANRGVRVVAVGPGYVSTEMVQQSVDRGVFAAPAVEGRTPMGRMGDVGEVAEVVRFLVSDAASYITGTHIMVDGGWTGYGGFEHLTAGS